MKVDSPRKKKLFLCVTKSNFGGAQRYVYDLATHLRHEYDVTVIFGGTGILHEKLQREHLRTISLPSLDRDIRYGNDILSFFSLLNIFLHERPDIIHLNSSKIAGIGAFAGRLAGIKTIIFTAHGLPFQENRFFLWKLLARFFSWLTILFSHTTIVVSANDLRLARNLPAVQRKLILIHTAIDPKTHFLSREEAREMLFPQKKHHHEENFWFGTIAELTPNKNLPSLVEAVHFYNKTHPKKIFLAILGEGESRTALESLIRECGAEKEISLLGFRKNAESLLPAFDLCILPSKKEGFPYALLEAGLAKLPVLATRVGGIPELIHHQKTGFLIQSPNTAHILEAITEALNTPEEMKSWGEKLHETILKNFSLEQMIEKTKRVYRQIP